MHVAAVPEFVSAWASWYSDSTKAQVGVQFLHIGGIMGAGGLAIASDRDMLRLRMATPDERAAHVARQAMVHRLVIGGLVVVVASGIAFLLADLDTYLGSTPYWIKMGLFALLLANGAWMLRTERTVAADPSHDGAWSRLRTAAWMSIALWFALTLLGTVLTNAA